MYNKLVKSEKELNYQDWIKENNYPLISPKHRGYFAEIVFRKFCNKKGIMVLKINPNIDVIDQIQTEYLKKIQQKELEKLSKISVNYFCIENNKKAYFVVLKMGTSVLNSKERESIKSISKNKIYLFRVFEDGEILIKEI